MFFSSSYASSKQWALPPHNLKTKYQEKHQPSVLVELQPTSLTLTTCKKVSEETASLQDNGLVSAVHHSVLRPGYLSVAGGHSPRGCHLARDLEGKVHTCVGCTSIPGVCGVCTTGSRMLMPTGTCVFICMGGEGGRAERISSPGTCQDIHECYVLSAFLVGSIRARAGGILFAKYII